MSRSSFTVLLALGLAFTACSGDGEQSLEPVLTEESSSADTSVSSTQELSRSVGEGELFPQGLDEVETADVLAEPSSDPDAVTDVDTEPPEDDESAVAPSETIDEPELESEPDVDVIADPEVLEEDSELQAETDPEIVTETVAELEVAAEAQALEGLEAESSPVLEEVVVATPEPRPEVEVDQPVPTEFREPLNEREPGQLSDEGLNEARRVLALDPEFAALEINTSLIQLSDSGFAYPPWERGQILEFSALYCGLLQEAESIEDLQDFALDAAAAWVPNTDVEAGEMVALATQLARRFCGEQLTSLYLAG